MKKIFLVLCFFSFSISKSINVYPLLDALGFYTDFILSKGKLSGKNEKIFQEVAESLGIKNREIKARNSGTLLRLVAGFNNALAMQPLNRVYLNESCLNQMSDGEKRFLMGHELSHHAKNHAWKKMFVAAGASILSSQINFNCEKPIHDSLDPVFNQVWGGGKVLAKVLATFSIWSLLNAQYSKVIETEADETAVLEAGASPVDGVTLLDGIYHPKTESWPLYAKMMNVLMQLKLPIVSLPIIKEFMPHLVSFKDRTNHILKLKSVKHQKNNVSMVAA